MVRLLLVLLLASCSARQYERHDYDLHGEGRYDEEGQRIGKNRTELAVLEGIYGATAGGIIGVKAQSGSVGFGLGLIGSGVGAGLGYGLSGNLTAGQVQAIESVTPWMLAHAAVLSIGDHDLRTASSYLVVSSIGGWFLGAGLAAFKPSTGTVAMANSTGMWVGIAFILAHTGFSPVDTSTYTARTFSGTAGLLSLVLATDLAIVAGAFLGRDLKLSRGSVFALDGILVASTGTALLIGGLTGHATNVDSSQYIGQWGIGGLIAGTALWAWLVPTWNIDALPDIQPTVSRSLDGTPIFGLAGPL